MWSSTGCPGVKGMVIAAQELELPVATSALSGPWHTSQSVTPSHPSYGMPQHLVFVPMMRFRRGWLQSPPPLASLFHTSAFPFLAEAINGAFFGNELQGLLFVGVGLCWSTKVLKVPPWQEPTSKESSKESRRSSSTCAFPPIA